MMKMKKTNKLKIVSFLVTLLILIFFNLSRLYCNRFCLQTNWYQAILNDNLHHYQLGLLILFLSLLFLRNKWTKLREVTIALGVGMIIDESMYLLPPLGFTSFTHNHVQGIIFELLVFSTYAFLRFRFNQASGPFGRICVHSCK